MAMTTLHQQACADWACAQLFGNAMAHFNRADALAAVQAVDNALDTTLNAAVIAVGGTTTIINGLASVLPAPWSSGTAAEKTIIAVAVFLGRANLI